MRGCQGILLKTLGTGFPLFIFQIPGSLGTRVRPQGNSQNLKKNILGCDNDATFFVEQIKRDCFSSGRPKLFLESWEKRWQNFEADKGIGGGKD
ncbi:MAG: hypothetical protein CM15mP58_07750 [Burkholderiaceae bacterium]|nr:MAG: hypothetical protein CM15mP58_07750 [Burkholderiaceae bacterium]